MISVKVRRCAGIAAVAGGLALGTLGIPAASAKTGPPPTLTGEQFHTSGPSMGPLFCLDSGSFSYSVSGTATGPYAGTFTETGSGTVTSASLLGDQSLVSFTATFTISSAAGQVTGTQTLTSDNGSCYFAGDFAADADTSYQATIQTSGGSYTDQGTTDTNAMAFDGLASLSESFTSAQSQVTSTGPTSKSQCMNGGWQNFPQFKNQGQCVAYVAAHG